VLAGPFPVRVGGGGRGGDVQEMQIGSIGVVQSSPGGGQLETGNIKAVFLLDGSGWTETSSVSSATFVGRAQPNENILPWAAENPCSCS
jgi:hypothetical protein